MKIQSGQAVNTGQVYESLSPGKSQPEELEKANPKQAPRPKLWKTGGNLRAFSNVLWVDMYFGTGMVTFGVWCVW